MMHQTLTATIWGEELELLEELQRELRLRRGRDVTLGDALRQFIREQGPLWAEYIRAGGGSDE